MIRVVITGIGAVTSIGKNINEYNAALKVGESGANQISLFDASAFKTQFACEVEGFDATQFMDRKETRRVDRYSHFGVACSDEAIQDAGLEDSNIDKTQVGVIFGSGVGGLGSMQQQVEEFTLGNGTPRYSPFMITRMISDMAAGLISIKHGYTGINYGVVSACATSTHALINAFDYIRLGKAKIIVSGGAEAAICETGIGGFNALKALSTRNDDYKTASRPFDKDRDGFVLGEGGGAIILEEYEHAKKRGAKIYGEVIGSGMTADAYHITAPHPDGIGAARAMKIALDEAGIGGEKVDYINVHGTSTPLGDTAELKAIEKIFGDDAYQLNISSTKSMTGHLLGAAGAIEAIAGILAIKDGYIPPTINHSTWDDTIDERFNLTLNDAQQKEVNVVMSNTFGFGGHNTTIIIKKI